MTKTFWRLHVKYYQYNDGSSNNGNFSRFIEFANESEAIRERDIINKAVAENKASVGMEDSNDELPDYIPGCCGGYYTGAKLFRVEEREVEISS